MAQIFTDGSVADDALHPELGVLEVEQQRIAAPMIE
jgi:hypothetical protein